MDFLVLAGYMKIIGETLMNIYKSKIINIYPSLLPSFKGDHGIEDAYHYGGKIIGITVHYVSKELDGGKIIDQDTFYVEDEMSLKEVIEKVHELEYQLYSKVLHKLLK
ncbi:MAG: formyltransferase family protein [Chitinophagaceae bacterium]